MATFTGSLFGQFPLHLGRKRIDLVSDDIRLRLHTATYVPDKDLHAFVSNLANELPTGGGYTVGGVALANKTLVYDAASDTTIFDADDISIANSTLTWRRATFADQLLAADVDTARPLIAFQSGDVDTVSSGGTTTITMPATGIVRLTT